MIELLGQRVQGGVIVTLARSTRSRRIVADAADLREAIHRQEFMRDVDALLRRGRETDFRATTPGAGYIVSTGASAIALAAATAKTIMYINSGAADKPTICESCVSFDGVTASAVPALIEACLGTKATNSTPGTGSTTFTPVQIRGWEPMAAACAAANACSSEPTVLTANKQWLLTPNGGLLILQYPLGREPTGLTTASTSGLQYAKRITAPAIVNVRGYFEFEET